MDREDITPQKNYALWKFTMCVQEFLDQYPNGAYITDLILYLQKRYEERDPQKTRQRLRDFLPVLINVEIITPYCQMGEKPADKENFEMPVFANTHQYDYMMPNKIYKKHWIIA